MSMISSPRKNETSTVFIKKKKSRNAEILGMKSNFQSSEKEFPKINIDNKLNRSTFYTGLNDSMIQTQSMKGGEVNSSFKRKSLGDPIIETKHIHERQQSPESNNENSNVKIPTRSASIAIINNFETLRSLKKAMKQ